MMRRTALAFVAAALTWLACAAPASAGDPVFQSQTVACVKSAQYSGGAATTRLVQNAGTLSNGAQPQIYVCGYVMVGATSTAQLEYGTGGTCGTGTTTITPNFAFSNPLVDHPPFYSGIPVVPNGNDLCVVTTGAATQVIVYYAQY